MDGSSPVRSRHPPFSTELDLTPVPPHRVGTPPLEGDTITPRTTGPFGSDGTGIPVSWDVEVVFMA